MVIIISYCFVWATFSFPFYGVSLEQAEEIQEKLEEIVANLLEIPQEDVEAILMEDEEGNVLIDFFMANPTQSVKDNCHSGEMPAKIIQVLEFDEEISTVLPKETSKFLI